MKKQLNPATIAIILVVVIGAIFGVLWAVSEAPKGKAEDFQMNMGGGAPPGGKPASSGESKPAETKSAPAGGESKAPPAKPGS
jgi:hypothetical protein